MYFFPSHTESSKSPTYFRYMCTHLMILTHSKIEIHCFSLIYISLHQNLPSLILKYIQKWNESKLLTTLQELQNLILIVLTWYTTQHKQCTRIRFFPRSKHKMQFFFSIQTTNYMMLLHINFMHTAVVMTQ